MSANHAIDKQPITLSVNGQELHGEASVQTTLQEFLHHHLQLRDVRYGCGEGVCGTCMILLDGEAVASCLLLAVQAEGKEITTAAGLQNQQQAGGSEQIQLLRDHFVSKESFQCGYCATGMLVSSAKIVAEAENGNTSMRHALSGNLCRCTGYEQIIEAIVAARQNEPVAEKPFLRTDLPEKLDATVRYPTDLFVENALVGRVLWSEHPHAKIKQIDTSEAVKVPGVLAVLTHKDIPGENLAGTNVFVEDMPFLAKDRVLSRGEAVALVAAENEPAAREAIRRIRVDYEPLPAILSEREAVEPGAPKLGKYGNVISQLTDVRGDIEKGWRQAEIVVEGTYSSPINDHACMEPEGGSGWLEGDTLVLRFPSHTPYTARKYVAKMLDLDECKIRIEAPLMGGSFGKYLVTSVEAYIALLVHKTGRPVRMVLDREEHLQRTNKRHPYLGAYKLGLKKDGTMVALDADIYADAGPYVSLTPALIAVFATEAAGAYHVPHKKVRARGVLTNNLIAAPMRGFGSQQISHGIECLVEKAARELGMPAAEIKNKNFLGDYKSLSDTLKIVDERMGTPPEPPQKGWVVGRGVTTVHAKYGYPYGLTDRFTAKVSVDESAAFRIESDVSDAGTGIAAGAARLVARHLNLTSMPAYLVGQNVVDDPTGTLVAKGKKPSRFHAWLFRFLETQQTTAAGGLQARLAGLKFSTFLFLMRILAVLVNLLNSGINWLKRKIFPYSVDSYIPRVNGSRSILMAGKAAVNAAEHFREKAISLASRLLEVAPETLITDQDGVVHRNDPARRITWGELAKAAGGELAAMGTFEVPEGKLFDPKTGNQLGPIDFMDTTHGCDLAIDPQTGETRILRYVACHDVGKILDPEILRGQIVGAIAMGIGQGLYEKIDVEKGQVLTGGLHEYHVPTSLDLPDHIEIELLESKSGFGPEGAKGIGEAGSVAAPIAIANAIFDATGKQPTHLPITPEEIVTLFEK